MKGSLDTCRATARWPINKYRVKGDTWEVWDSQRFSHPGNDNDGSPLCNSETAWTARRIKDDLIISGYDTRGELIQGIDRYYE